MVLASVFSEATGSHGNQNKQQRIFGEVLPCLFPPRRNGNSRILLTSEAPAVLPRGTEIFLGDGAVPDRPDHKRHVAGQVGQMVLTRVTFIELLEMNERVVPGVEKEILLPALPVV